MNAGRILTFFFLLLTVFGPGCGAQSRQGPPELTGTVVALADGDSFTLLNDQKEQVKVRLHGIDAPEKNQPFGTKSQQALSELIFQKQVRLQVLGKDRYKRTIAKVWVGEILVNAEMLRLGMAWHFKKYDQNPEWAAMETEARTRKRGLFADSNAIPPWDWRKTH